MKLIVITLVFVVLPALAIESPQFQALHSVQIITSENAPTKPSIEPVFVDNFETENIEQWLNLQNGEVVLLNDGGNGVLRKSGHNDPHGGWAPLTETITDFEVVVYTRKVNELGGIANRYSLTDFDGNGYGIYLRYDSNLVTFERRDSWSGVLIGEDGFFPGGLKIGQWYTLRIVRSGSVLTAEVYTGRIDPATTTPQIVVSAVDSAYDAFSQFNINGGYEFDTDNILVTTP